MSIIKKLLNIFTYHEQKAEQPFELLEVEKSTAPTASDETKSSGLPQEKKLLKSLYRLMNGIPKRMLFRRMPCRKNI